LGHERGIAIAFLLQHGADIEHVDPRALVIQDIGKAFGHGRMGFP